MKAIIPTYFLCLILVIFSVICYVCISGYAIEIDQNIGYTIELNGKMQWPAIGYNTITSGYGSRNAPTKGASSFHYGIDIGAPTGATIVAASSGKVIFTGFKGAGGNTIIVENGNIQTIYCHVDSEYYPVVGTYVVKGSVIGRVGPKNVYGVPNNPYKDSNGNPTNGATTGPHLHFAVKKDGAFVNPLNFL